MINYIKDYLDNYYNFESQAFGEYIVLSKEIFDLVPYEINANKIDSAIKYYQEDLKNGNEGEISFKALDVEILLAYRKEQKRENIDTTEIEILILHKLYLKAKRLLENPMNLDDLYLLNKFAYHAYMHCKAYLMLNHAYDIEDELNGIAKDMSIMQYTWSGIFQTSSIEFEKFNLSTKYKL